MISAGDLMEKIFKRITFISLSATVILWGLYFKEADGVLLSLSITASVIFYHFAVRLLIGKLADFFLKDKVNFDSFWFRPKKFENKLYKFFKVRKWKKKLPTYKEDKFDLSKNSLNEIAVSMCHAEIIHEAAAVLSFLPLLAVKFAGAFWVFFITSFLAACFDMSFAVIQRYNRPGLLKILKRVKN